MTITEQKSLSAIIRERHSVRKYDPSFKISKEEILEILEEAALAPSSSNLQPWKFMVFQDQETKTELRSIAYNQEQVETSSAVIAILGDREMYKNVEKVYNSAFEAGYLSEETKNQLIQGTNKTYPKLPSEVRENIAAFDAGLVSMQLMLIAKAKGYDTVTMGGFDKVKFTERFEVEDRYFPIVLISLGKAAAPAHKTTRLPIEDAVSFI